MEPEKFRCNFDLCEKAYSNLFNLKRHIESFHKGIKKHTCDICNRALSSKQNLREHKFKHFGMKPYICSYKGCRASYRQSSQLALHTAMHIEVQKRVDPELSFFNQDLSYFNKFFSSYLECRNYKISAGPYCVQNAVLPPITSHFLDSTGNNRIIQ
jgi:uncharacterized Zn-finger protein